MSESASPNPPPLPPHLPTAAELPPPPPLPTPDPPPPTFPPPGKKFPCLKCGARLEFDPEIRGLKCPYCGYEELISRPTQDEFAKVKEIDLEVFLRKESDRATAAIAGHSEQVRCSGCGAMILLEDRIVTDACPYCGTFLENKPEAVKNLIQPESILPFAVSKRQAIDVFSQWVNSLWFAPNAMKKVANLGKFTGIYVPFWTYDAQTYTDYDGQRGTIYYVTQYVTLANGQREARQVQQVRWDSVSGEIQYFFDDVLIRASKSLPPHLIDRVSQWNLKELEPFRDEFLSGYQAERYSTSLKDGFSHAREVIYNEITGLIRYDIGGDYQRIGARDTQYAGVTFKHTLLPIWVANYRYHNQLFQVVVNGRTNQVAGDRPWSYWKIGGLVSFLVLMAVLVMWLSNR